MGNKRERKGERLLLYGAGLLIILFFSADCGTTLTNRHLNLADKLIKGGDYDGALKEYEVLADLFPVDSPGDIALFHIGLIWAYPDNPRRDYETALEYFERLACDFPRSELIKEARVMAGAINEVISNENRITDFEEKLNRLNKELAVQKETDSKIEEKNEMLEETVRSLKKQVNILRETGMKAEEKNKNLEEAVMVLKNQLNALKEIDLGD